ncbi:MAG: hypothetical protein ACK5MQ_05485 [Pikeienuella sp.]
MNDLSAYASLSARLAVIGPDDEVTIAAGDFPEALADHSPFDGLVIDTSFIHEIGWAGEGEAPFGIVDRSRGFAGFALPEGYRRFGLWLLHLLFSGREWAGRELTRPTRRVRWVYARIRRPMSSVFGLQSAGPERYSAYIHYPQEVWRHPFAGPEMTPVSRIGREEDRPFFAFGWSRDALRHQWDISKADQIIFEATPQGVAAMAGLMLDFAHPEFGREQIDMEPPHIGFAATQPRSIEARFWLPDSVCFPGDDLDRLCFSPFR